MKYLKLFEKKDFDEYKGMIFINKPSTTYFKSAIALQVIFVDEVNYTLSRASTWGEPGDIHTRVYKIDSDSVAQFNVGGGSIQYVDWHQEYVSWEFDKIKFMTTEEFYENYKELFIRILENVIEENKKNKVGWYKERIKNVIDRLIIPETEHIINADKYNL